MQGSPHAAVAPRDDLLALVVDGGRRALVALAGTVVVLAGLAMLVLPGPGVVTVVLGLGLLGREFPWAARMNAGVRARLATAAARAIRH
jgi:hypothetical protein